MRDKILLLIMGIMYVMVAIHVDYANMDFWDYVWIVSVFGYIYLVFKSFVKK